MTRLEATVARCASGEVAPETLWDVLCDPDNWDLETLGALETLSRSAPRSERGLVKLEKPTVVLGDLVVDGDLECLSHTLVLGNLHCKGYLYSGIHGCLIVGGDLTARSLEATRSYWLVGGSLEAETMWLSTYGFLLQRGELRTRLLMLQMSFELRNDVGIHAATRIETEYLPEDEPARTRLREVLAIDDLLDTDGDFDSWTLLRRVARGERVFRS